MRVVAGTWRGQRLQAPAGRGTRPTSDKVREAMFDVLAALLGATREGGLGGRRVLDLYAGSGALGIEALSRGADSCTFVESNGVALKALRANLSRLEIPVARRGGEAAPTAAPWAAVRGGDVRRALQADARGAARYTLVFADPPYDRYTEFRPALARLLGPVLEPSAILVVETGAGTAAELPWTMVREKRYGDTRVTFLVAGPEESVQGVAEDDVIPVS